MKTTLSKIALIVISVISLSSTAANKVDPRYTNIEVDGDSNTVNYSGSSNHSGYNEPGGRSSIRGVGNTTNDSMSFVLVGDFNNVTNSDFNLLGQNNNVTGIFGNVMGDSNVINSSGLSNVFGNTNNLNGANGNIFGSYSSVSGDGDTIFGNNSSINGDNNAVTGDYNNVTASLSNAYGYKNIISGPMATKVNVLGTENNISGSPDSNVIGSNNTIYDSSAGQDTASSDFSNVIGYGNNVGTGPQSVTIGNYNSNNGDFTDSGGITIGSNNTLKNSKNGTVIGNNSSASDQNSLVLGSSAQATNGGVAIGYGSVASSSDEISFGNAGTQRRLTNVAAGQFDTDVTNVKQMRDGDEATLTSAKGYTDARETVINSRVDNLMAQEKSNRITGDADTLAKSGSYTDKQTAVAISTSNTYTDTREQAINSRTDGLVADEKSQRIAGDAETLQSANAYTNNQVSDERQSRIDGDRNTLNSARFYTDQRVDKLNDRVNRNERRANAGIAGAMAMSSIPHLNYVDSSFGMAAGTYRGETAIAAGVQKQVSAMSNVRVNLTWDTSGSVGAAAGFAVGW